MHSSFVCEYIFSVLNSFDKIKYPTAETDADDTKTVLLNCVLHKTAAATDDSRYPAYPLAPFGKKNSPAQYIALYPAMKNAAILFRHKIITITNTAEKEIVKLCFIP